MLVILLAATYATAQKHYGVWPADYINQFIGTTYPEVKQFLGKIKPDGRLVFEMGPKPNKEWGTNLNLTEPK